jgi:hypothetical protein
MQTADPVTLFVTACFVPTALASCFIWSAYLVATGTALPTDGQRRLGSGRRP